MNWAFMKLNEAYLKNFNALIKTKEASPRRFRAFMTPSIESGNAGQTRLIVHLQTHEAKNHEDER
jgi:hypothetical protein